ncbi:MAG: 4-hydroxy-tetrahydrodipicolinate synthase [Proteobacteria bacterium]|nr:4-hydroxy-tetrahydrodipicolinate synthase [Pseudomonadota bacterium]
MSKQNDLGWRGAWAAIPTPFGENGELCIDALSRHVAFLCANGIDGIVACGTTGESATLSTSERAKVLEATLSAAAGRVPVIAGVGTNDTKTTIAYGLEAKAGGADGLLVVTPYYNKPNQEGQFRHFMAVADAVDLPQILYNVPGRTGTRCLPETLGRLNAHDNIVGIKDATADMVVATQTRCAAGQDFLMFSGDDGTTLPFISVGGIGAISVVANVAPRLMHDIIAKALEGQYDEARALHERMLPLCLALFSDTSPIPLKAMLAATPMAYPKALRSPLFAMSDTQQAALCAPFANLLAEIV